MYIIDFNPQIINNIDIMYLSIIEQKINSKESITNEEVTTLLDTINYIVRYKINPNLDNYDYKCDLAQSILYHYLKKLNCNPHTCMTQNVITNNIIGHSFITIQIIVDNKIKTYLIDPTYIQFFKKDKCTKDNYFISQQYNNYILLTPDPGYFINKSMNNEINFLLNHGYIELTEQTARIYGDSFLNTKTGININLLNYQTIPGEIYINSFLKGNEPISKTEEELINMNLYIPSFQELNNQHKKR